MVVAGPEPALRSPYRAILGEAYSSLHPSVRRAHEAPLAAQGVLDVEHGAHWLVPILIRLMTLPSAGRGQRVRLDVAPIGPAMAWTRQIGSCLLRTRQSAAGPALVERNGIGRVAFELGVEEGALLYRQIWIRVAGITIPRFLSPRVTARVSAAGEGWFVDVTVGWRAHLVCHYAGMMTPS